MKCLFFLFLIFFSCSESTSAAKEYRNPKIYFSRYSDPNRDYKNIRMIFHDRVFSWRKVLQSDSIIVDSLLLPEEEWTNILDDYNVNSLRNISKSAECGTNKESFAIFDEGETFSFFFEVNSSNEVISHHVEGMDSNVLKLITELRSIELKYHSSVHQ